MERRFEEEKIGVEIAMVPVSMNIIIVDLGQERMRYMQDVMLIMGC